MNEINNAKTGAFEYRGETHSFNYYTDISIVKKTSFVTGVTNTLVSEDHYQSVLRGLIFGFQLINVFSDALSYISDEEKTFSLTEIEEIVMETKIVDIIMANARVGLIDELNDAVDKDIEYKTGIHRNPLGEAVASLLGALESRVKDVDLKALTGFAEAFKDIPVEEMTSERLWDAYSKSEAFKTVRAEISEKSESQDSKVIKIADEVKKPKKRGRKPKAKKEEAVSETIENDDVE